MGVVEPPMPPEIGDYAAGSSFKVNETVFDTFAMLGPGEGYENLTCPNECLVMSCESGTKFLLEKDLPRTAPYPCPDVTATYDPLNGKVYIQK